MCEELEVVRGLIDEEIETLDRKVRYRISRITEKSVRYNKVGTSTPIYVPKKVFCNVKKDLTHDWIGVHPLKESYGTGYDGVLKKYTKTMVSHIVIPTLAEMGICEVRKSEGYWEVRLL